MPTTSPRLTKIVSHTISQAIIQIASNQLKIQPEDCQFHYFCNENTYLFKGIIDYITVSISVNGFSL